MQDGLLARETEAEMAMFVGERKCFLLRCNRYINRRWKLSATWKNILLHTDGGCWKNGYRGQSSRLTRSRSLRSWLECKAGDCAAMFDRDSFT
jgi:hypothetical protein